MYDAAHYQLMAAYNRWMNERLFDVCRTIPDADRRRDMGAFFGSIHATLDHIYYGDRAWMARFCGQPLDVKLGDCLVEDFEALATARAEMDRAIIDWTDKLEPAWLDTPFEYASQVDGKTRRLPARVLVSHMFNHQTHHRGQVTTLMTQLGYEPGITDIPWLPDLDAVVE